MISRSETCTIKCISQISKDRVMNKIIQLIAILTLVSFTPKTLAGHASAQGKKNLLQKAYQTVKSIDYLPFSYIRDGCFARALYIGMELTAEKITSNNQYLIGSLRPNGAKWGWHVAPLIASPSGKAYIIDPAFSDKPLSQKKWVSLSKPKSKAELLVSPITNYRKKNLLKKQEQKARGYDKQTMIQSFKQVPKFQVKDVSNACSTAYKYIGKEKISDAAKYRKRKKLITRTRFLIRKLQRLGKIESEDVVRSCIKDSEIS